MPELLSCPIPRGLESPHSASEAAFFEKANSIPWSWDFPAPRLSLGAWQCCRQRGLWLCVIKTSPGPAVPGPLLPGGTGGRNNGTGSHTQQAAPGALVNGWAGILSPASVIWHCYFLCLPPGSLLLKSWMDAHLSWPPRASKLKPVGEEAPRN